MERQKKRDQLQDIAKTLETHSKYLVVCTDGEELIIYMDCGVGELIEILKCSAEQFDRFRYALKRTCRYLKNEYKNKDFLTLDNLINEE